MNLEVTRRIAKNKVVPIFQLQSLGMELQLAETLIHNGLPIAEISLNSPTTLESIDIITKKKPELLLIAGTVFSQEQARLAIEAGAHLVSSPYFNTKMITYCLNRNISIIPGVTAPSEVETAMELGLNLVKFIPEETVHGTAFLKLSPRPSTKPEEIYSNKLLPSNIIEYISSNLATCCGGSWLVPQQLIKQKNWNKIGHIIRGFVDINQQ